MRVHARIDAPELPNVPAEAQRAEALGFDGVAIQENAFDTLLHAALAAEHTSRVAVATHIAVAFARSPMLTAYAAWDIQRLSEGRFELGLGTQVKGHIERRFSNVWSSPVPRMREYAGSLRAIWDSWQNGTPLDYRGDHYSFTLMSPYYNPGPLPYPPIPLYTAAVGPGMSRMAGELFDGIIIHRFSTADYTREVMMPAFEKGIQESGRRSDMEGMVVTGGGFVIMGATEAEVTRGREQARGQIAWYASTRTYKRVMDHHGWGEVCLRLHRMSLEGRWDAMPSEVTDEMLDTFCLYGTYDKLAAKAQERYGGYATIISLGMPADRGHGDRLGALVEELRG